MKGKNFKLNFIYNIFILIIVLVIGSLCYLIHRYVYDIYHVYDVYAPLEENPISDDSSDTLVEDHEEGITQEPAKKKYSEMTMAELKELNSDYIGNINVSSTNINYPVVKTTNNEYYLNHDLDRSSNQYGTIYMDYRNSITTLDRNTVIYGHSIKADHNFMFGQLRNLLSDKGDYTITLTLFDKTYKFKVFSTYVVVSEGYYITTKFTSDVSYKLFLDTIASRSVFDYGDSLTASDKIITLSTCYSDTERLVVHAKLIN